MNKLETNGVVFTVEAAVTNRSPFFVIKYHSNFSGSFVMRGSLDFDYIGLFGVVNERVGWQFQSTGPDGEQWIPKAIDNCLLGQCITAKVQASIKHAGDKGPRRSREKGLLVRRAGISAWDVISLPLMIFGLALVARDAAIALSFPDEIWDNPDVDGG